MEEGSILNNKILEEIAIRLGSDWYNLSFHLKLPDDTLNILQESVIVPVTQKPFQMFKRWREIRQQSTSEIHEIYEALIKCHRRDLADFVMANSLQNIHMNNILMKNLSDKLVREWFTLGIYLGISYSDLTIIDTSVVPQCYKSPGIILLHKWKDFILPYGDVTALSNLLEALTIIKRNDLIIYIKKITKLYHADT